MHTTIFLLFHLNTCRSFVQILVNRTHSLTFLVPLILIQRLINPLPPLIQQTIQFLRLVHNRIVLPLFVFDFTHIIIKLLVYEGWIIDRV